MGQAPGRAGDGKDCRLGLSLGMGFKGSCGAAGQHRDAGWRGAADMGRLAAGVKPPPGRTGEREKLQGGRAPPRVGAGGPAF
jgi:hypothetical protein